MSMDIDTMDVRGWRQAGSRQKNSENNEFTQGVNGDGASGQEKDRL
jgi:hypothetical protein